MAEPQETHMTAQCRLRFLEDRYDDASRRIWMDPSCSGIGGIDILINTAALFPSSPGGTITAAQWALTPEINVITNYLLMTEAYLQ